MTLVPNWICSSQGWNFWWLCYLWKRHEVVLELQVVQAQQDLWFRIDGTANLPLEAVMRGNEVYTLVIVAKSLVCLSGRLDQNLRLKFMGEKLSCWCVTYTNKNCKRWWQRSWIWSHFWFACAGTLTKICACRINETESLTSVILRLLVCLGQTQAKLQVVSPIIVPCLLLLFCFWKRVPT